MRKQRRGCGCLAPLGGGYTAELLDVLTGCSSLLAGAIYLAYCLNRPDPACLLMRKHVPFSREKT